MIEVQGIGKNYGELQALADVSFTIGQGEVVGLLGPNGAGKTTLLRVLTGYFEPSAGRVTIDGVDVVKDPIAARRLVGYLPEQAPLYPEMLVQDYLQTVAELREIPLDRRRPLLSEAIWATGLDQHLVRPIGELSKGFRQRVGIAQAILHKPRLLILDEPTSGLDPTQVDQVRELIERLSRSTTVLFSTHILPEVEQVCDRALVILDGRLRADARLEELRQTRQVLLGLMPGAPSGVEEGLRAIEGVDAVRALGQRAGLLRYEVHGASELDLARAIFHAASEGGWELCELRPVVRDLESVFRELVQQNAGRVAA